MKTELIQGSEEWKALRKTKVTSTDAAVILGVSPWKTPLELWRQKTGRAEEDVVTPVMRKGSELEEPARQTYSEKYKIDMVPNVVLHPQCTWKMASLDGINFERDRILEIKCGEKAYEQAVDGVIPPYYYAQMQHAMHVSGAERCDYFCWLSEEENVLIEVKKDEEFLIDLLKKEEAFYLNLINDVPPESCDKDILIIEDLDHPLTKLESEWVSAKANLSHWQEVEKDLREKMIEASEGISCEGQLCRLLKYERKGSIDYASIPELEKVDLEQYRKPSSYAWRISELK